MIDEKYFEIIDKGECLSTINGNSRFNWCSKEIMNKAGRSEWVKDDFYPANGMVGKLVDRFENPLWGQTVNVILIQDKFYVPMALMS